MTIEWEDAFSRFGALSGSFAEALTAFRIGWEPEAPPVTVAMSLLGDVIVSRAQQWTVPDRRKLFDLVELLLREGDECVQTAIATGLLEALLGASSAGRFDFAALAGYLGPEAKRYCKEWDKFTGCETPGRET